MIIFGKNGSGKSSLLRGIRDKDKKLYHYCSPERSGNIEFNPSYQNAQYNGEERAKQSKFNQLLYFHDQVIAKLHAFLSMKAAKEITDEKISSRRIENLLHMLLPKFQFEVTGNSNPISITYDNKIIKNTNELSSGESQLYTLALDLIIQSMMYYIEDNKGNLFLIDESDTHLHPDLLQQFGEFLVKLFDDYQYPLIIATHSTTLLSALGNYGDGKTSVIYLNNEKEEQISIKFNDSLRNISSCLGGHVLMGPLFGYPILLVEGNDDYRIWSEIPRINKKIKFSVVPCYGLSELHKNRKALEEILSSLQDTSEKKSGYAIIDRDNLELDLTSEQKLIPYLLLNCRESENLYLTNEILQEMGYTWDSACEKVISESNNYHHVEELKNIRSWDKKNDKIKDFVSELSQILDTENLLWSQRLGKVMGNHHPVGELADFLGQGIISTFWPNDNSS